MTENNNPDTNSVSPRMGKSQEELDSLFNRLNKFESDSEDQDVKWFSHEIDIQVLHDEGFTHEDISKLMIRLCEKFTLAVEQVRDKDRPPEYLPILLGLGYSQEALEAAAIRREIPIHDCRIAHAPASFNEVPKAMLGAQHEKPLLENASLIP